MALLRGELSDVDWKIIATSTLLALVSATTGSGLAARHRQPALGWATAVLSLAAFVLVLVGMWPELDTMGVLPLVVTPPENVDGERYAQVLGVVLVIQLVATAVAPILRRLGRDRPPAEDAPPAVPALAPGDRLADEIVAVADKIERLAPGPLIADECERLGRLARGARSA